jgi:hypothetical protein
VTILTKVAERRLTDWILQLPERTEYLREAAAREEQQRVTMIEDRDAISRLIRKTEERLANLTLRLVDGKVSDAAYDVAAARLNQELADQKLRFTRAAARPRADLVKEIPAVVAGWPHLSPAAQNRAARALLDRIVVLPGNDSERMVFRARWDRN